MKHMNVCMYNIYIYIHICIYIYIYIYTYVLLHGLPHDLIYYMVHSMRICIFSLCLGFIFLRTLTAARRQLLGYP